MGDREATRLCVLANNSGGLIRGGSMTRGPELVCYYSELDCQQRILCEQATLSSSRTDEEMEHVLRDGTVGDGWVVPFHGQLVVAKAETCSMMIPTLIRHAEAE